MDSSTQNSLTPSKANQQLLGQSLLPSEPLWKRVPTRDEHGQLLSDFMMLIPGLKSFSQSKLNHTLRQLENILQHYASFVVFADLNLKLSVLWVSVRPMPGICAEIPAAIHACIPEAKLVAQHHRAV